jgi:hypothetical protein
MRNMIERVNTLQLVILGVGCQSNMKWNSHIKEITRDRNRRLHHLMQCRNYRKATDIVILDQCGRPTFLRKSVLQLTAPKFDSC